MVQTVGMVRGLLASAAILLCVTGGAEAARVPVLKPPAPASPFVSDADAQILSAVVDDLGRGRYAAAMRGRDAISDPVARSIATWGILGSSADGLTLAAYDAFLDAHPDYPNPITLQRKAERLIDDETPPEAVIAFFESRDPVSGFGKLHLGRALLATGNEEAGKGFIRRAWIEHNFNQSDSREILRRHGDHLSEDHHFEKADRALFNRSTAGLEDVRGLLDERREREVEARSALLRRRSSSTDLFNRLPPESQRDSGVLHAMVRYLRRSGREEDAIEVAKLAPLDSGSLRDPGSWYEERKRLARWAIKNGLFNDAYNLSAYSGLEEGADFAEAEFMAGWLALRFLVDPDRARAHFDFLLSGVDTPISMARGHYWLARSYQAMADPLRARAHYRVAADFPYTYYGQLAVESLGEEAPRYGFPKERPVDPAAVARYEGRNLARAMEILDRINERGLYRRFALALDEELSSEDEIRIFSERVRDQQEWDLVVRAGKVARGRGLQVPEAIYPLYPLPGTVEEFTEPALVLGLSRQESEFRSDAVSSANAKGMMQLLNSTARITARKENIPYSADRLLTDPAYNFTLGAAHLSHLIERFGGSYVMVLAGYNAGPHRVDDWVETYGDPRDPDVDPVDWVELIPFAETRNYVMRVLENTQVYRTRLGDEPLGHRLVEDLTRGSASTLDAIGQPIPAPRLWMAGGRDGPAGPVETHYEAPPLALRRIGGLSTPLPADRTALP